MGLFDRIFRRRPPIRDTSSLADFIDRNAAFVAQKGIYEYSRARAGYYAKVLFGEATFQEAAERARWQAFPLCLAMVAEVVEGVLRSGDGDAERRDALVALVLSVFDRYPAPALLGNETWSGLRAELVRRLQLIGLHARKRVIDIPVPFEQAYFDLMPIHEKLRGSDFPTICNYLKVTLLNVHDELTRHIDIPALLASLRGAPVPPPAASPR